MTYLQYGWSLDAFNKKSITLHRQLFTNGPNCLVYSVRYLDPGGDPRDPQARHREGRGPGDC